jgi:uncharacterized membrane protein
MPCAVAGWMVAMLSLINLIELLGICAVLVPVAMLVSHGRRIRASERSIQQLIVEVRRLQVAQPLPTGTTAPVQPAPDTQRVAVPVPAAAQPSTATPPSGSVPPVRPAPPSIATQPSGPKQPAQSLEERLGTRWAVWVGGIALALGGLLLARYSIEQGVFGPGARIVMGLFFAAALVGAGEWFRRGERANLIAIIPSAHIPGILTAAGTATAFGTIYAAHALYGFIGPALTFVLLGLTGVATMFAAALHGPALAGLGLAGSYVAPLLVASSRPAPWPVVIYLACVAASALGLARIRQWLWLAALSVAGAFLWGLPFLSRISGGDLDWTLAGQAHTLIQLILVAGFIAIVPNLAVREHAATPDPIAAGTLGALALLAIMMLFAGRFELAASIPFVLAAAAILLAAAWHTPAAASAAVFAGLVVLGGVLAWPGLSGPYPRSLLMPDVAQVLRLPANVSSFISFATFAALGVAAVCGLRLMRGRTFTPATAGLYALAATATPLLALVIAYLRVTQFDRSIPFAFAAAVLAALFAWAAGQFQKREIAEFPGTRLATGVFAAAAIAALCFGMAAFMERGYLTVALALAALGAAYVAVSKDIPLLRHAVTALAVVVLARLAWNPRIMGDGVGTWPIVNWLLIGYGVPAAAFYASARMLETKAQSVASRVADAAAILFAGLLCFFQIHHALNNGDALAPATGHVEQGLLATLALGFSYALMRLDLGRANVVFRTASIAFGVISAILIVLGLGLFENPGFTRAPVKGVAIFSSLLIAYLLPGIAAAVLARAARPHRPRWYVTGIAVLSLCLLFGYVTLEVRHIFQGTEIGFFQRTGAIETWAYSAAWLALGIAFLAYGIIRSSLEARLASAALVFLSIAKVFLFDLNGLTGLWRALSFIVLGLVLIGIGLVYQNFVFARPPAAKTP